jgi:hypothetical protein
LTKWTFRTSFDLRVLFNRHLRVRSSTEEVLRGHELEATVEIHNARRLDRVEVGLVCTELYLAVSSGPNSAAFETREHTEYESWMAMDAGLDERKVRLRVPAGAPFSYEGENLSFRWQVVAHGERRRRLDVRATCDVRVLP